MRKFYEMQYLLEYLVLSNNAESPKLLSRIYEPGAKKNCFLLFGENEYLLNVFNILLTEHSRGQRGRGTCNRLWFPLSFPFSHYFVFGFAIFGREHQRNLYKNSKYPCVLFSFQTPAEIK